VGGSGLDGSHSTRMRYRVNTQSNLLAGGRGGSSDESLVRYHQFFGCNIATVDFAVSSARDSNPPHAAVRHTHISKFGDRFLPGPDPREFYPGLFVGAHR
jgi:hypothetical protein